MLRLEIESGKKHACHHNHNDLSQRRRKTKLSVSTDCVAFNLRRRHRTEDLKNMKIVAVVNRGLKLREKNLGVSEAVAFVVFLLSSFLGISLGDPRATIVGLYCNTTYASSSSVLADNFVPAFDNLSSLVNQNGFGTSVGGQGPNAIFALAQCFEDLNSTDCSLCFSEIRTNLPECYPMIGGRIFLDGCFCRYENFSFFNEAIDSQYLKICNYSRNSSLPGKFTQLVNEVVRNVSTEAIGSQGFAVGSVSRSNLSVYALAQCWDNLDSQTCNTCLQAAVSSIISYSPATEGRLLNAGCYLSGSEDLLDYYWFRYWSFATLKWEYDLESQGIFAEVRFYKSLKDVYGSELSIPISQFRLNFSYQELRKATKNFDPSNKLGQAAMELFTRVFFLLEEKLL
ncbi:hypothetical protein NE237_021237 [Protea cynaroides]|uniref:Gnk2-homologous domain-containing protein n=1 Tax=Protea cynaroides TaxID=273540 RepID=A0A9Q0H7L5_9MAGN|nr:hypothetical protein NE237_021237 [Protea cynaroides]